MNKQVIDRAARCAVAIGVWELLNFTLRHIPVQKLVSIFNELIIQSIIVEYLKTESKKIYDREPYQDTAKYPIQILLFLGKLSVGSINTSVSCLCLLIT